MGWILYLRLLSGRVDGLRRPQAISVVEVVMSECRHAELLGFKFGRLRMMRISLFIQINKHLGKSNTTECPKGISHLTVTGAPRISLVGTTTRPRLNGEISGRELLS